MKILIIPIAALLFIAGLGIFEHFYVNRKFDEFETRMDKLIILTKKEEIEIEDVQEVEDWWSKATDKLHVFTPHAIIRDIEFWLAEAKGFVETKNWEFALAKMEVVKTAAKSIPDSYGISFGNIF